MVNARRPPASRYRAAAVQRLRRENFLVIFSGMTMVSSLKGWLLRFVGDGLVHDGVLRSNQDKVQLIMRAVFGAGSIRGFCVSRLGRQAFRQDGVVSAGEVSSRPRFDDTKPAWPQAGCRRRSGCRARLKSAPREKMSKGNFQSNLNLPHSTGKLTASFRGEGGRMLSPTSAPEVEEKRLNPTRVGFSPF